MQAGELYNLGCKAYSGDEAARREWFARLAPLAARAAKPYSVLPSLLLGKAATESGFASDIYEISLEARFGAKMARKAQKHNNLTGMNCFKPNQRYLQKLPLPAWTSYRATFADYGPHWHNGSYVLVKDEPWKHYKTVEDCLEDWCANIRSQAEEHGKAWGETPEEQLLAIESYTPEGSTEGVRKGLHFQWQEQVMQLIEKYDLGQYDKEDKMTKVKVTTSALDEHIKRAYEYAHAHCYYAPTDKSFPPMEDRISDCAGLLLRAAYTLGYNSGAKNIDQVIGLCLSMGMIKSTDISDAWKHHGVVCMQDKCNAGTQHVNHVFYSLGGTGASNISKYDLGSNDRIKAPQPFKPVRVNEWENRMNFLCVLYVPDKGEDKLDDVPAFTVESEQYARIVKAAGVYAGPGTAWRKIGSVKPGDEVLCRGIVTNQMGHLWKAVRLPGGLCGYVGSSAVKVVKFSPYNGAVKGTDGSLSLRVGAGGGCYKIADIPEGETVRVDGAATAKDGGRWLHVRFGRLRGFVSAAFVKKR